MRHVQWIAVLALSVGACNAATAATTEPPMAPAQIIVGEHLPVEVRELAPDPDVLDAMSYGPCGASFGSYSAGRRYCHESGHQAFSMVIGMSDAQMIALDPAARSEAGQIPEGIELVTLADGTEASFIDVSFYPEIEGVGPVVTDPETHLFRLNWKRASGVVVAINTSFTEDDPSGVAALGLDDLLAIANSIDVGRPLHQADVLP